MHFQVDFALYRRSTLLHPCSSSEELINSVLCGCQMLSHDLVDGNVVGENLPVQMLGFRVYGFRSLGFNV